MSVLRILNPVTWKRKNLTDAERYTGKLIRIKWNTRRFITHWDFDALPDVIDLYGMEWTACSDVTISALQKITDGTFIIADPHGGFERGRREMYRFGMCFFPLMMGRGETGLEVPEDSEPMRFERGFRGELVLHNAKVGPKEWSPFPKPTWIRIDLIGMPRVAQKA